MLTIRQGSWDRYQKKLPKIYNLHDIEGRNPFYFYTEVNQEMFVIREGNDLWLESYGVTTQSILKNKLGLIEEMEYNPEDSVLIDFALETPQTVYNYTTEKVYCLLGTELDSGNIGEVLAFDRKLKPFKVSKMKSEILFLINRFQGLLIDSEYSPNIKNIETLVEVEKLQGLDLEYHDLQRDVIPFLKPEMMLELLPKQYRQFMERTKKSFTKNRRVSFYENSRTKIFDNLVEDKPETPLLPPGTEVKYFFSKILNQIPVVNKETDVILDMDVKEYGIQKVSVIQNSRLLLTIKVSEDEKFDHQKYIDLLGHNNFNVVLVSF